MSLDQIEKLLDALVMANTGWTGELNGPIHQAHLQGRREIEARKQEILRNLGVCPNCGCNK